MAFTGQYKHAIDNKNRLFIPAKFRQGIKNFYVTIGLDGCLYLYPEQSWNKLINKFENLSLKNKAHERAFKRAFFSVAIDLQADKMGRILIPQDLKKQAKINNKVIVVGVRDRVEIWSQESWNKYYSKAQGIFNKLAPELEI
ncbi:MAG: division/cell wall cluster transcriptional repressor MraZ [Elusimicrobia bacterium]|nr:division/cell wall cluster transcriptional repressor MraZ [Elusimicrobiota bacterium]MBU2614515.1 division/cell wall cluster transcriptional repressor MraZ [Elusimicrobiota bacterium]